MNQITAGRADSTRGVSAVARLIAAELFFCGRGDHDLCGARRGKRPPLGQIVRDYLTFCDGLRRRYHCNRGCIFWGVDPHRIRNRPVSRGLRAAPPRTSLWGPMSIAGWRFAFGWNPCVRPVLAAILFTAAGAERQWTGRCFCWPMALG